ncbi:glucokinase [Albidovulum sp.]|uniref:glucokinase n=1 Tax=Albidovulum sp. TaxID=1872424 RepID=UPI002CB85534|nr:glucokinase [Paracoccaceae bacterium]HRV63268.1 glucokinase [Albidovulum sp.]
MTTAPLILADVGGTNTRVALARAGGVDHASIRRYPNAGRPGLEPILADYLADLGVARCAGACVAAAGPVEDGRAEMTNLAWVITRQGVAGATGAPTVAILNDLQAQGHALGHLAPGALSPVLRGEDAAGQAQLVIGVGTGFNAAPVHDTATGRLVAASESGHVGLPVMTRADLRLAAHVGARHGFAGVEEVLSGRGLEQTFAWVAAEAGTPAARSAAEIMAGIATGDALAVATGRAFVRMLGMVAGNLALTFLPFGGIYLIGGVSRAFAPYLDDFGFAGAFCDKGRFSDFMTRFSVSVVEDDYAALTGCAEHLAQLMARGG